MNELKRILAAVGIVATALLASATVLWIALGDLGLTGFLGVWPWIAAATALVLTTAA